MRYVRDEQKYECYRPIFSQIVGDEGADPRECESCIRPLFWFWKARSHEDDSAQEFGDAQNDPQLLRVSPCSNPWTAGALPLI